MSQFGYEIAENLMMLMCLCRLIDSDDFETDDALEARIMDDDFQCGQCQIRYLMNHSSEPRNQTTDDECRIG